MISCRLEKDANTVGLWHMFEGSGTTAKDYSGIGANGVITGAPWVDGLFGKCLSFNNTASQYVSVPYNVAHNCYTAFTVECIFKANISATAYNYLVARHDLDTNGGFELTLVGGNPRFELYGAYADAVYSLVDLRDGKWHYLVATYDNQNIRIYLDGGMLFVVSAVNKGGSNTNVGITFGRRPNQPYYYNGALAEVRISNIARSAAEIKHNWLRKPQILVA